MDRALLLESLGRVEPPDAQVLERTATALAGAVESELHRTAFADDADVGAIAALDLAAERSPTGATGSSHQSRRWRRSHRLLVRAAAVVLVAGAAAGAGVLLQPGSPAGPGSAAATVLRQLATVAASQPMPSVPGPGQYLYVDSEEAYTTGTDTSPSGGAGYTALVPENRQIWQATNGSGRILESYGQPLFLTAQDRANWEAAGSPPFPHPPGDMSFSPGGLGGPNVSNLPTDPSALAAEIASRKVEGGPPGPAEDFTQVADLLRETDASPALRAALYQVAAGLPGHGYRPQRPNRRGHRLCEQWAASRADLRPQDQHSAR
jgi:hypothetical protein